MVNVTEILTIMWLHEVFMQIVLKIVTNMKHFKYPYHHMESVSYMLSAVNIIAIAKICGGSVRESYQD